MVHTLNPYEEIALRSSTYLALGMARSSFYDIIFEASVLRPRSVRQHAEVPIAKVGRTMITVSNYVGESHPTSTRSV